MNPGRHLKSALEAASALNCPLLCLCSRGSDPDTIVKAAVSAEADVIVIDTSDALGRLLPSFSSSRIVEDHGFARRSDLSPKRNLGLLISRAMNWRKILFLDDDIRHLVSEDLRALAALLDDFDVVGLGNTGFPDNSVVCHAYRKIGGHQETFVSGGLLSIRADKLDGFFPDIYNEDWFFLRSTTSIARAGAAHQDAFDPFETPDRARDQELGDVLAEGVYWLRDEGEPPSRARQEGFWKRYLNARLELIDTVIRGLEIGPETDDSRPRRLAALAAARTVHTRITPSLCTAFIRAWETDRATWRAHLDASAGSSIEDCLRWLQNRHSPRCDTDWAARVHRTG